MFKTCLFHMEFVLLEVGLSVKVLYLRTIFPLLRTEGIQYTIPEHKEGTPAQWKMEASSWIKVSPPLSSEHRPLLYNAFSLDLTNDTASCRLPILCFKLIINSEMKKRYRCA